MCSLRRDGFYTCLIAIDHSFVVDNGKTITNLPASSGVKQGEKDGFYTGKTPVFHRSLTQGSYGPGRYYELKELSIKHQRDGLVHLHNPFFDSVQH